MGANKMNSICCSVKFSFKWIKSRQMMMAAGFIGSLLLPLSIWNKISANGLLVVLSFVLGALMIRIMRPFPASIPSGYNSELEIDKIAKNLLSITNNLGDILYTVIKLIVLLIVVSLVGDSETKSGIYQVESYLLCSCFDKFPQCVDKFPQCLYEAWWDVLEAEARWGVWKTGWGVWEAWWDALEAWWIVLLIIKILSGFIGLWLVFILYAVRSVIQLDYKVLKLESDVLRQAYRAYEDTLKAQDALVKNSHKGTAEGRAGKA